jgi:pyridoxine 5-phosphate synthase
MHAPSSHLRLGVNVDHVATLRNARGGHHPCPVAAAKDAVAAGADGITAHLREDRRHIRDADMRRLKAEIAAPLNFEMAATEEMLTIALALKPNACCLVPEKREERTTEGGLDVVSQEAALRAFCAALATAGIRTSLFIEPTLVAVEAAKRIGADIVELHTGRYAECAGEAQTAELERLRASAHHAHALGLEVHAGHGLTLANVGAIAAIASIVELNIGHALIGDAVFVGLSEAVRRMRAAMDAARANT